MNLPAITLHLNFFQWSWLSNTVRTTAEIAPVHNYELETLVIQDMYKRRLHSFTFFNNKNKMGMALSLHQYEAMAINSYFSETNHEYTVFMRMFIEPKLISGKVPARN